MRFVCPRGDLLEPLARVASVAARKSPNEVLNYVLVEALTGKKGIQITGTDLETGITAAAAATVKAEGGAVVHAQTFLGIVRELPEAPVDIDASSGNRVALSCARAKFSLPSLPREHFPTLPPVGRDAVFKIPQPVLRDLVRKTAFAAADGADPRAFLSGVYLVVHGNRVRMVATDGHRLALAEAPFTGPFKKKANVIVPRKALDELVRNLADEGDVEVTIGGQQVAFEAGETRLVSRLIHETFPNYEQVIPKSHDRAVKVSASALHEALRRVSVLADQKTGAVRFRIAQNRLQISTKGDGEAQEEVEASCEGGELELAFKARYFVEALRAMDEGAGATVRIEFSGSGPIAPAVLRQGVGDEYLVVIMPLRF